MNAEDKLLIVDDVFDSGRSIKAILDTLNEKSRKNRNGTKYICSF